MYSPRIKEDLILRLYKLKMLLKDKKPMTYHVNEAIERYLKEHEEKTDS